ncbi:MAG: leucine-rich repeat domain-containing protein [Spirochaetaceae bacterium]|jgi:hypothetical protein|nr:leucine-rich repeat domain-containing protein [Spirochaetaceae bacterium]
MKKHATKNQAVVGGLCLLVLALAACANPALPPAGEETDFSSVEALAAYLAGKPANTAAAPYRVSLSGVDISLPGAFDAVLAAFNGRYVELDASRAAGAEIPARNGTVPPDAAYLAGIILPESAGKVGRCAFYGFPSLKTVVIPDGVTEIGSSAFAHAASLVEVTLSGGLRSLGTGVFENCPALALCRVGTGLPSAAGEGTFTGDPLAAILVPSMTVYYQYAAHIDWRVYKDRLRLAEPDPAYRVYDLYFDTGERRTDRDDPLKLPARSVAPGARLVLAPVLWGFTTGADFTWEARTAVVDADGYVTAAGETVNAGSAGPAEYFTFRTAVAGTYRVTCTAREGGNTASASVLVTVATPAALRPRDGHSARTAYTAFAFVPSPDQFCGTYPPIDVSGENGHNEAWVANEHTKMLRGEPYDHTGSGAYWDGWSIPFLGYFIFGWDHSIARRDGGREIGINGNNFGDWTEPGIVSVMQDTNGNGLPDDTWYELKGSQHGRYGHIPRYALTVFRPWQKYHNGSQWVGHMIWVDNQGNSGSYRQQFPFFVDGDYITFSGGVIAFTSSVTGYVDTPTYLFSIADAVEADGSAVDPPLTHIDFARVHGAIRGMAGAFGGLSAEMKHPYDASMPPSTVMQGQGPNAEGKYTYVFQNISGYQFDLFLFDEGEAEPFETVRNFAGSTTRALVQSRIVVDFAGGNASMAINGNVASFANAGGNL